jgi:hypothetical protein
MYPYMNEDVAFERLKDLQREMENSYALAGRLPSLGRLVRILGERVWWIAGLAMQRPPRRHPASAESTYDYLRDHVCARCLSPLADAKESSEATDAA